MHQEATENVRKRRVLKRKRGEVEDESSKVTTESKVEEGESAEKKQREE